MYTNSPIQIGENIQLEVNAYWVHVYVKGHPVFVRRADEGPWLDARHKAIVETMDKLEKLIKEAVTE